MATSSTQSAPAEQQASRWLAERARPFAEAPLQKRSAQQFISLSQGTPDLPTPRHAIEAVEAYLRDGTVYYTFHDGMPEPSAIDHIKTFALVAACEASSVSGRPVVMAEFYEEHGVPQRWLTTSVTTAGVAAT